MTNSEENEKMADIKIIVSAKTQSQAVYIEAVVIPEITSVLENYKKDIVELGEEQ